MKRLICAIWRHKWNHTLADVGNAYLYRIDCLRCGEAIDGAKVRTIRDEYPVLWAQVKWHMPR